MPPTVALRAGSISLATNIGPPCGIRRRRRCDHDVGRRDGLRRGLAPVGEDLHKGPQLQLRLLLLLHRLPHAAGHAHVAGHRALLEHVPGVLSALAHVPPALAGGDLVHATRLQGPLVQLSVRGQLPPERAVASLAGATGQLRVAQLAADAVSGLVVLEPVVVAVLLEDAPLLVLPVAAGAELGAPGVVRQALARHAVCAALQLELQGALAVGRQREGHVGP
mmetsp:Transcript_50937/g.131345  ORF Transcript_50937/g.131345 Transcript_50937/m.131345 type:complete len:222 (+) Transcript_50937:72-737(+)